jgi:puromycin-sensitive aminopeptidase
VRELARPHLDRLGWQATDGEDDRTRQLRGTLVGLLGTTGADPDVVDAARQVHDRALDGSGGDDPAVVAAAVDVVAANGTSADLDLFVARMESAPTPQERQRYQYALGDFPGTDEFDRVLDLVLSDTIRSQNAAFVLRRTLLNRENGDRAWAFVSRNWDAVGEKLPSMSMVRMAEGVRGLSTPALAHEVESFFAEHPLPQAAKSLAQHLEALRVNVGVREREAERLGAALAD